MQGDTKNRAIKCALPFLAGFVAGVFLFNVASVYFLEQAGLLNEYSLARIRYLEINYNNFFFFVLKKRMVAIWILTLLSTAFWGITALYLYFAWMGGAMGILISAAVARYGLKGILLMASAVLPQIIIYVPAYYILYCFCKGVWDDLYGGMKFHSAQDRKKQKIGKWMMQFVVVNLVVIIGVMIESYVNPLILTKILKIF